MKAKRTVLTILAVLGCLFTVTNRSAGQPRATYQQMSEEQRIAFVALQARSIARQISGRDYEFTPAFDVAIRNAVGAYVKRIGNGNSHDARLILQRWMRNSNLAPSQACEDRWP